MRAMFAILVVLAAAPTAAQAQTPIQQPPTMFPLHACYRSVAPDQRETVGIVADNFTPGARVDVTVDGTTLADPAIANENGEVLGAVVAPYTAKGVRPFAVTLTEEERPDRTVTQQSRVAALDFRLKPASARPSSRVRFLGRGFTDSTTAYAHYVRAGKLRKTVALGTPKGPCGRIDVVRRQIPVRHPATGRWTLQVDNQKAYSPRPGTVFVRLAIDVKRIVNTSEVSQ